MNSEVRYKFSLDVSRMGTRLAYGVLRTEAELQEMLKLYTKYMIMVALSDQTMLDELTDQEQKTLAGLLYQKY